MVKRIFYTRLLPVFFFYSLHLTNNKIIYCYYVILEVFAVQKDDFLPVIQELMNVKNNAIISGNLNQLEKLYVRDDISEKCLEKGKRILLAKQKAAVQRKTKLYSQSTQVFPERVIRAGNIVKMNINELITWWLIEQGRLRFERQQHYHEIILEYKGKWLIKDDTYRLEPKIATIPRPIEKSNRHLTGQMGTVRRNVDGAAKYDREAAVQYAHKWWNGNNPNFVSFSVDCTNYVSQVLYAGGIPMNNTGKINSGWWYAGNGDPKDKWSYSWAVAHSLRWYLATGSGTLRAEAEASADKLMPGDVICYDWDGDGVWQHNTIVVGFTSVGQPLVNAHTNNSQNRFWDYQDSVAWTEKTKYLFWKIRY